MFVKRNAGSVPQFLVVLRETPLCELINPILHFDIPVLVRRPEHG
jgi:hypothetical protein